MVVRMMPIVSRDESLAIMREVMDVRSSLNERISSICESIKAAQDMGIDPRTSFTILIDRNAIIGATVDDCVQAYTHLKYMV